MSEKICNLCYVTLNGDLFYKDSRATDGMSSSCKKCSQARNRANRAANIDKWRQYDKDRQKTPERRAAMRLYEKKMYGQQKRARARLHYHVKVGNVQKKPCAVCGDINSQAHHHDYNKPLDVTWYCKVHHLKEHNGRFFNGQTAVAMAGEGNSRNEIGVS